MPTTYIDDYIHRRREVTVPPRCEHCSADFIESNSITVIEYHAERRRARITDEGVFEWEDSLPDSLDGTLVVELQCTKCGQTIHAAEEVGFYSLHLESPADKDANAGFDILAMAIKRLTESG